MFNYYGVDWLLFFFISIHIYLLGKKQRIAFLFAVLGCICGVIFGCMAQSVAEVLMNSTFAVLHCRAYALWKREEDNATQISL